VQNKRPTKESVNALLAAMDQSVDSVVPFGEPWCRCGPTALSLSSGGSLQLMRACRQL